MNNYSLSVWDYHGNKLIDLKSKDISIIGEVYNTNLRSNINGTKELSFVLPLYIVNEEGEQEENFRWDYIESERKIKLEYKGKEDWFIIKTLEEERNDNGSLFSNVQCKHISNLLTQSGFDLYIDDVGNATELLTKALQNSGWTVGEVDDFRNKDDSIKIRTLKLERSNHYNAVQEVAELFGGYLVFNSDKTVDLKIEVGKNNGVVFRYGKNLKSIRRTIGNADVITKLWVEGGTNSTGTVMISSVNPTGENYILNFGYFIDGGFLNQEQIDAINNYESLIKPANDGISEKLSNITVAVNEMSAKQADLQVATLNKASKEQTKKEVDLKIQIETDTAVKNNLISQSNQLQSEINTLNTTISSLNSDINNIDNLLLSYEQDLVDYRNTKKSVIDNFNTLLADFIREGIWQDTNYVDPQALYEDALEQSQIYAYPQVSYEMSALDLSLLTGYEIEQFECGDIIRGIDEKLKVDTVFRITEENIPLDNPQNVTLQVGNYYSSFEDLFKRISESAEIIKQRQEIYERAIGINPDGTVNYDVLQKTFDNNKFRVVTGTNNSVIEDENGITIVNVADNNKMIRLNSGGIFITVDGGQNWRVGLSPEGLSALNITSGIVDTKLLQIWNSENPRFKWNADGLFAFGSTDNQWIRFNEDGIYFTRDGGTTFDLVMNWAGLMIGSKTAQEIENSLNQINNKADQSDLAALDTRVESTETNITTINGTVAAHNTRIESAESKITPNAIVQTVRQSEEYLEDLGDVESAAKAYAELKAKEEVDSLEIGGRNLILHSDGQPAEISHSIDVTWLYFENSTWEDIV